MNLGRAHSLQCIFAPMTFGAMVRAGRIRQGMKTQQQLADRVEVHVNTVGAWERDDAIPQGQMLSKLAEVLLMTTEELTAGDPRFSAEKVSQTTGSKPRDLIEALNDPNALWDGQPLTEEDRAFIIASLRAIRARGK